jgi:hypothetical protein
MVMLLSGLYKAQGSKRKIFAGRCAISGIPNLVPAGAGCEPGERPEPDETTPGQIRRGRSHDRGCE